MPSAATVADNSVNSASVVNEALTGSDINESTLGIVPTAASTSSVAANSITGASVADNSLGGADVDESSLQLPAVPDEATPVFLRQPPNTEGFATIFEAHGLRVEAQCSGASGNGLVQFDHEAGLLMRHNQFDSGVAPSVAMVSSAADNDVAVGTGVNTTAHITVNWRRESTGKTVNLDLTATSLNSAVGLDCAYFGTALADG